MKRPGSVAFDFQGVSERQRGHSLPAKEAVFKRRNRLFAVLILMGFAWLAGCSGFGSTSFVSGGGSAPFSFTMTDTPPAGVTVLSFEVTVTSAVLNPNNISLISTPTKIEVKHLETEAAFLSTVNVPAGTYNSITLNLTNPELTILNIGPAITAFGQTCNTGQVCEFKPSVAANLTISSSPPFPLVVSGNSPTGLLVDVNLNNVISNPLGIDFTAVGAVAVAQLTGAGLPQGQLGEIDDLVGVVANKDATNNQFTLQTTQGNFTVKADTTTQFEGFDGAGCAANNFTCVANGQVVEVNLGLLAAGGFLARAIEFEDAAVDDELEGVITSVVSSTQFQMVITEELRNVAGVDVGNPVTVNLQAGASFHVDTNGLTVPPSLQAAFEGSGDTSQLLPGQAVQVRVRSLAAGPPIVVATNRVRLRFSRLTASVSGSPFGSIFNVTNLPSLFTSAGITQIRVQTSAQTEFEGVSGVAGLNSGDTVSLRGLLFSALPNPVLVADKVRKRS
jgi:hypothetical protein